MYQTFEVHLKFNDRVYGTMPRNEDVLSDFVKAKYQSEDTSPADTDLDLDHEVDKRKNFFRKTDMGIYIGDYQVKAMFGEAASLLGITTKKRGSKQTLKEGLSVVGLDVENEETPTGNRLYLLPKKTEADGEDTHTGTIYNPSGGMQSIIKTSEYIENASLVFRLEILENRIITSDGKGFSIMDVKMCLAHGAKALGLGGNRKYGGGRFTVTKFENLGVRTAEDIIDF